MIRHVMFEGGEIISGMGETYYVDIKKSSTSIIGALSLIENEKRRRSHVGLSQ